MRFTDKYIVPLLLATLGISQVLQSQQPRFTLLSSEESGVDFINEVQDSPEHNILKYANFYGGAGVGVADFDGDGNLDIYFAGNMSPDKLYRGNGDMTFKDVTKTSGIVDDGGWATGVVVGDVNNDGHPDIYVTRELYDYMPEWRRNLLYINKGNGTFREVAAKWGADDTNRTRHAAFLDYDRDGLLDLFLLTQPPNPGNFSEFSGTDLLVAENRMRLLRNTGNRFQDVTDASGLGTTGFPNAVSASDLNGDGWTDLYIANDFYVPDYLMINNGDGTFSNQANDALGHMSYYSMGVDVADIDNDGLLDIFVVDMVAQDNFRLKSNMSGMDRQAFWDVYERGGHYQYMYNAVQHNNGNGSFSDIAQFTGMSATDWSWANLIADFDNDGLKDTFITNGLLRDIRNTDGDKAVGQFVMDTANEWIAANPDGGEISIWDILDLDKALSFLPSQPLKNFAFRNRGDLEFESVASDWGLDQASFSNGAAYGDFDNDGDLDLVVSNINAPAFVYRNNTRERNQGGFIRLNLVSLQGAPTFGTRAHLYAGGIVQTLESTSVRGIYSSSEPSLHFGMGSFAKADSLVITWPDGQKSRFRDIPANSILRPQWSSAEGDSALLGTNEKKAADSAANPKGIFSPVELPETLQVSHKENDFDDYEIQVLLPHQLSRFGPALASGDINGDGLEDLFFGGAANQAPRLFLQQPDGTLQPSGEDFWKREAPYEDVDAVFLDVNADGHLDLYVVSGGNAYPAYDIHYMDRLYLGDGSGSFRKGALPGLLPSSGSRVVPGDFDRDGDTDLFVGARHLPHEYPAAPSSALLENRNGQLIDVTSEIAPELKTLGMVTDAFWEDINQDGTLDLLLTGEWMPLTALFNHNGQFKTGPLPGLEKTKGWWFSLTPGDFDGDGDIDFIAGNLGLNYKYKTTPEKPFDIYYEDFDGNGKRDIVLGYYNGETHYPLRGFSCSSEQIPMLKKEIGKYDAFAAMNIEQVYGTENLNEALHLTADTFASIYVENLGGGKFGWKPLPNAAQMSNINDGIPGDFDQDGNLDVLVAGNLFVSEIETPRNDAGEGLILFGDGRGNFTAADHRKTGFFARSDVRHLKTIVLGGRQHVLVANNNDQIQLYRWNSSPIVTKTK